MLTDLVKPLLALRASRDINAFPSRQAFLRRQSEKKMMSQIWTDNTQNICWQALGQVAGEADGWCDVDRGERPRHGVVGGGSEHSVLSRNSDAVFSCNSGRGREQIFRGLTRRIEHVAVFAVPTHDVVADSADVSSEISNGGVKPIAKLCARTVLLSNHDI